MSKVVSNKKEIFTKAVKVLIIRLFGYGFGFLFFWVVANKYGAKAQGVFSIAFLFLAVGVMVSKLGIEIALVKWIARSNSKSEQKYVYYKSLRIVLISTLIMGSTIFLLAPFIAQMYNKPDIENSIRLAAITIPFLAILDVSSNLFKGRRETTTFGIYFHLSKFFLPLVVIGFFFFQDNLNLETPMLSYFIGLTIVAFIVLMHVLKVYYKEPIVPEKTLTSKFMIFDSYPMMISSSIVMIMGWSDVFVLGFFVSEEKIGIYSTAIKLATIVSFSYNAIATIAAPKIAKYFNSDSIEKLKETIGFSSKIMALFGLPVFIVLFIFAEFFLSIFGQEYVEGATVLRILLAAQLTNVITGPVGPIFNMTNNQKLLQRFIALSLCFNIVLSLLLVNRFELEGVAIASAFGMILWNVMGSIYIYRKMNIKTWASFNSKKTAK